jgi:hypothetical protein
MLLIHLIEVLSNGSILSVWKKLWNYYGPKALGSPSPGQRPVVCGKPRNHSGLTGQKFVFPTILNRWAVGPFIALQITPHNQGVALAWAN